MRGLTERKHRRHGTTQLRRATRLTSPRSGSVRSDVRSRGLNPKSSWALGFALVCGTCGADETLRVPAAELAATIPVIPEPWRASPALAGFATHEPATAPVNAPVNPLGQLRFRDQQPLVNRLRRLQAVPFVTVWDSRDATVYVGVNRDGETGLHLRQKRDDRGSRARKVLLADPDPLRAPTSAARKAGPRRSPGAPRR